MKHTPGPWKAKDCTVCCPAGVALADCRGYPVSIERKGNAHLIAKAPELYEALTKLVECIEVIKHDRQDEGTEPDWFDWVFINQELKRSKEALGQDAHKQGANECAICNKKMDSDQKSVIYDGDACHLACALNYQDSVGMDAEFGSS